MKIIAGLLYFVYFLLPGQIPEAAEIGPIKGLVERLDLRKNKWEKVRRGDSILKDDRIRTGRNSRAELVFKNKVYLRSSANSEMNVRSLFGDTKDQNLDINLMYCPPDQKIPISTSLPLLFFALKLRLDTTQKPS